MPIVTPIETCPNAGADKADTASAAPRNQFAFMSFPFVALRPAVLP